MIYYLLNTNNKYLEVIVLINYKLKAERVKRNLTQTDMCQLLNIHTVAAYSMKENGKRSFTQNEIKIISKAFELNGDTLKDIFFSDNVNTKDINNYKNILTEKTNL